MNEQERAGFVLFSPEGGLSPSGGENSGEAKSLVNNDPNPEVVLKPRRRTFTAAQKLRILEEADRCAHGELGALLRREGVYASHLQNWQKQREESTLSGLAPKKRGPQRADAETAKLRALEHENARLQKDLTKAHAIIELQKKIAALLDTEPNPGRSTLCN